MRNNTFHQAVVGRFSFEGVLSADGPYITASAIVGGCSEGGVALAVSGLRQFAPTHFRIGPGPWGWYIVKYGNQPRVFLEGFTQVQVDRMRAEFGLLAFDAQDRFDGPVAAFYASRAWASLVQWVDRHPRIAKRNARFDPYLPGWHDHALMILGRPMPKRSAFQA